ncbi:phosphatase PAP2 family protein [Emticicia sp. SJ17W-69]|uniref:phosphatase PAP2 family protein n=1 Tax=Emticicia sp. SJ17W-69 TaxID=3421657 RepID=UPI003EB72056
MLKILINNRSFFFVFLLWLIVGALLQLIYTPTELMFWVNAHNNELLDIFFKYLTILGEDLVWLGLLIGLLFSKYALKTEQTDKIKFLLIAWLAKVFVSVSLKNIFSLPRPMEVYQNMGREIHVVKGVEIHYFQSFPSGHTMTAFAFACFVTLFLKQPKWGVFSLLIAILVGYSRMYLFQHFPRDVFAGGILGVAVVTITWIVNKNLKT